MLDLDDLSLHEQLLLLALNDEKGTMQGQLFEYGAAGAMLTELLLRNCIVLDESKKNKKRYVKVAATSSVGDPLLVELLAQVRMAKRPAPLSTWVRRAAGTRRLRHRIADRLRYRGILGKKEGRVLFVFSRQLYPTMNPAPEHELVERMRAAVLGEDAVPPRTAVMVTLARQLDLLRHVLTRAELKARKRRLKDLDELGTSDEATRAAVAAVKEVIAATHAAVMAATSG